jgi:hypothetical protein
MTTLNQDMVVGIHFTRSESIKSIVQDGFISSVHIPQKGTQSTQWLGDGVYFFEDSNRCYKTGYNLVKGKDKGSSCKISAIRLNFFIDRMRNFDLDDPACQKILLESAKKILNSRAIDSKQHEIYSRHFEDMIKDMKENKPFCNLYGSVLGLLINILIPKLENKYGTIEIVSFTFRQKGDFSPNLLYNRKPYMRFLRQFCVRRLEALPKSELWTIVMDIDEKELIEV